MLWFISPFPAYKKLQRGSVSVILGADIPIYSMAAEKLGIPLICTSLVERDIIGTVFYMMPKPTELCRALEEFMTKSDWRTVGVIYEETLGKFQFTSTKSIWQKSRMKCF